MGRPLKIAKAQAILTLTATNGTTEVATVSQNLTTAGVTADMPFVIATTTGGLTAGTTYWILEVLSTTTFTVSDVPPNANVSRTPYNLSNAGPVTVSMTVYPVDTYFNNPDGASNTYGVVGGNTAIYGQQIACKAAVQVTGTGTIYASTGSAVVSGVGTDFTSQLAVGSYVGLSDGTALGFVTSIGGIVTVTTASTAASTDRITINDSTNLVVNSAIVFAANIGGLIAGTVYFVQAKPTGTTITVSATPGGTLIQLNDDTVTTTGTQDTVTLVANAAAAASGSSWVLATAETAYIVRQKGKTKYLVKTASGLTGACYTANLADAALTPNTMNITATAPGPTTIRLSSVNDYFGVDFTAVSGNPGVKYITSFNGAGTVSTTPTALTIQTGDINYTIVDVSSS